MTKTPERIEVIEEPQPGRRRRFTAEEKRRLVAEAEALLPRCSGRRECTYDGVVVTLKGSPRWCSSLLSAAGMAKQSRRYLAYCCDREAMGWLATSGGVFGEMVCALRKGASRLGVFLHSSRKRDCLIAHTARSDGRILARRPPAR
jgi:hypothetical protein